MKSIERLWPAPKNLTGYAKDFYKRVGKQLISCGVLSELDRESFISLASAYHIMNVSLDNINTMGAVVTGSKDEVKKNPSFTNYKMASDIFTKLSKRFYLCPQDRAGVRIEKQVVDETEAKFFG